ncbi:hypothetical protein [Halosimplex marinum]|uniref:hypothetical protein n=1 Tax=Halosimplex marinum TaxID=3396620 RepID=UPI003F56B1ED
MRVLLDTMVWVSLKEDRKFLEDFIRTYRNHDIEIVFSHGNFLDLVRRENQDKLSAIIGMFSDEYLGPFRLEPEGEYIHSDEPLVLALIDEEWYEHCKVGTRGYNNIETLRSMFRDGDFDAEPASSVLSEFIEDLRGLEDLELEGHFEVPEDVSKEVASKKIGLFAEYTQNQSDGLEQFEDSRVPLKKYVFGMSMIYISETYHEPEPGDYRDAIIWSQAIYCDCDILWTEAQWKYEHPIIKQVMERLNRKPLDVVHNFEEFQKQLQ